MKRRTGVTSVLALLVLVFAAAALATTTKHAAKASSRQQPSPAGRPARSESPHRSPGPPHRSASSSSAGRSTTSSAGTRSRRTRSRRSRSSRATRSSASTRRSPSRSRSRSRPTRRCSRSSGRPAARKSSRRRRPTGAAGSGWVSGSATRVSLTDGVTDGVNRRGFFFRTVPNDGVQGPTVANYIQQAGGQERLHHRRPGGLLPGPRRQRAGDPEGQGRRVTRDSVSQDGVGLLVADREDPGQHAGRLHPVAARRRRPRRSASSSRPPARATSTLFGSDGLFDPATWKIAGSYDSFFPVDTKSGVVKAYAEAHGGDGEYFGAPTYVAAQVVDDRDHQGVRGRQGNPRRGAEVHRQDEHPGGQVAARVPDRLPEERRAPATAGSGSTRSSPTARYKRVG